MDAQFPDNSSFWDFPKKNKQTNKQKTRVVSSNIEEGRTEQIVLLRIHKRIASEQSLLNLVSNDPFVLSTSLQ